MGRRGSPIQPVAFQDDFTRNSDYFFSLGGGGMASVSPLTVDVCAAVRDGMNRISLIRAEFPGIDDRRIRNALHGLVKNGCVLRVLNKTDYKMDYTFVSFPKPKSRFRKKEAPKVVATGTGIIVRPRAPMPFVELRRDPFEALRLAMEVRR